MTAYSVRVTAQLCDQRSAAEGIYESAHAPVAGDVDTHLVIGEFARALYQPDIAACVVELSQGKVVIYCRSDLRAKFGLDTVEVQLPNCWLYTIEHPEPPLRSRMGVLAAVITAVCNTYPQVLRTPAAAAQIVERLASGNKATP